MSRFRRRLIRTVTAALAVSAIAAPGASAITGEDFRAGPSSSTQSSGAGSDLAPTTTRTIDDGFDYGSAAVGAGSATALLLVGGAAVAVSRRRRPARAIS